MWGEEIHGGVTARCLVASCWGYVAKALPVPQRGVGPGSELVTGPLLQNQSPGQEASQDWGELRQVLVLLALDLGAPWVLQSRSQGGGCLCVCLWLRVEDPQGELLQRRLYFFIWLRNWISLLCDGTEPARHQPGVCLQAGGRWAGRPSGWSSEALGKCQKALLSCFHRTRPEDTQWTRTTLSSN